METPSAEIHQVGKQMIHLGCELIEGSDEYLALIEGGGICLANSLSTAEKAQQWARRMFDRLYPLHRCGLGCIRMPGAEFLADAEALERLVGEEETHPRS